MCSVNNVTNQKLVFGIDPTTWEVIAALSQVAAAIGALSLLYITWKSGKDAKSAIASSQKLASATEKLVVESKTQRNLSVLPVIEASFDQTNNLLSVTNRGNGPLLDPSLQVNDHQKRLIGEIKASPERSEIAVLSCDSTAVVQLSENLDEVSNVELNGILISGGKFVANLSVLAMTKPDQFLADTEIIED